MRAALLSWILFLALPARAAPDLVIEAELTPARVYVGAEARLTLRVLRAAGVAPGTLRPPRLGEAGELSLLGVRMYETERAGTAYRVFERTNILVPRRAGRLLVPGAEFESARDFTELFERDAARPRVVRGPQQVLEVLPPPASASEPFLPARALSLEESWSRDPHALSAGESVTRILVLRAEGLAADRLPRLEMSAPPFVHLHHDQPELATEYLDSGMLGQRVQRIVLMPVSEGEIVLPALEVRWWDVGADTERVAALPGRTLRLQPLIAPPSVPAQLPSVVSPAAALRSIGAAILLLVGGALWLYLRGSALRDARSKLRAACRSHDARAARVALIEWWTTARPGATVPPVRNMGSAWDVQAQAALAALDAALYAGRAWDGRAFWRALRPWLRRTRARRSARASPVPDRLFKLHTVR